VRPHRRECAEEAHRPPAESEATGAEINIQVNRTEKISELRGEGNERNNSKHGRYSFKYFCGKW